VRRLDPSESSSRWLERPGFDLYSSATWERDHRNGGTSGPGLDEALDVDPVHLVEVRHIGQKHGGLHNVGEGCALRSEQRLEICDRLAKLRADTNYELTGDYTELARADNPFARANDGSIGTRRYGRRVPRSRGISDRSS
jgi:hypothetical protein